MGTLRFKIKDFDPRLTRDKRKIASRAIFLLSPMLYYINQPKWKVQNIAKFVTFNHLI
jgi:hypothetical protein